MLSHRLNETFDYEIGIDESGRGTLFGSVFIAGVIFPRDIQVPKDVPLNDSKKLTPKRRAKVRQWIESNALQWHVASRDAHYIDKHNILKATLSGMHECIEELTRGKNLENVHVVIDGNYFVPNNMDIQYTTKEKADAKYIHVAAASILAKEHHDDHIRELVKQDPTLERYKLDGNMGYGSSSHISAIKQYGPSKWHRMSFKPCKDMAPVSVTLPTPDDSEERKKQQEDIIKLQKLLNKKQKEYLDKYGESYSV